VDRLLSWLDWPIKLVLWLALGVGLLMMLHITAEVIGRVVFNRPLEGTTEIVAGYYMVAVVFLPLAWVARRDDHIIVELFTRRLKPRTILRIDVGVGLLTLAYIAFFPWQTGLKAIEETTAGEVWETASGFVAIWPSRWLLPVSGALMTLYVLLRILRDGVRAFGREAPPSQPPQPPEPPERPERPERTAPPEQRA